MIPEEQCKYLTVSVINMHSSENETTDLYLMIAVDGYAVLYGSSIYHVGSLAFKVYFIVGVQVCRA